jgi:hypothetical protein
LQPSGGLSDSNGSYQPTTNIPLTFGSHAAVPPVAEEALTGGVGQEASVRFLATLSCAGEWAYQQPQASRYAVGGLRPGRA